jgi:hypothetical protein
MADTESLRDSVAAAFEQSEGGGEVDTSPEAPAEAPAQSVEAEAAPTQDVTSVENEAERERDEAGRFAKAKEAKGSRKPVAAPKPTPVPGQLDPPGPTPATPGTPKPNGQPPTPTGQPAQPATPEAVRAPQSWKATTRELWGQVPAPVQAEIHRREREIASALQETAESRRVHAAFQQAVAPYEGMIRAEGGEPIRAVQSLLQTAAALRTAPPVHKAQLVAQLVKTFGVPIDALDAALSGQAPQQGQAGMAPGGYQDPRVDQLLAQISQANAQRSAALQAEVQAEVSSFQPEFLDDVRDEMADILQVAAARGVKLSLEDAYNRAVLIHPEISQVLEQRKAASKAANASASMQRAKAAGSSVRSHPAGANGAPQPQSMRDYVAQAFEDAASR